MRVTDKIKAFYSMLMGLNSLTHIGFKLRDPRHVPSNGLAGESYEFIMEGRQSASVEFTFYPATADKGDYIVVYLIDYKTDKGFSLDAWLQKRYGVTHQSPFKLSNYSGEYDQQLKQFEKFVNDLFYNTELKSVLEGKEWIDINFNWRL